MWNPNKYACSSQISTAYLEQPARRIGLFVNSDKTVVIYYDQDGVILLLNGKPLKLDQFIYLGSNISSTESDVSTHVGKEWTAINNSIEIWSLWWNKTEFFQAVAMSVLQ